MIRDPGDRPSTREHLHALNDPGAGILVIRPLPYPDSPLNFTFSVLEALGKTLPSTASATLPSRPWELAVSWAAGYQLRHLVADRAHTLRPQLAGQLRDLAGPPGPGQPRLWLIDAAATRGRRSVVDSFVPPRCQVTIADPGCLRTIAPFARPAPAPAGPLIPDDLPADNFMTFRAACARHQDPAAMARLDQLWSRTFHDARQWVSQARYARAGDPFCQAPTKLALSLSLKLAARTYAAATGGEALTVLRATQAGLLREGLLLHHQPWPGDPGLGHRLTPTVTATVNRAITTAGAAAATLYLLFPYDRRNAEPHWHPDELTLGDIGSYSATVTIAGTRLPVPRHARPALLAHLAFRRTQGATAPAVAFFDDTRPRADARRAGRPRAGGHQHRPRPARRR